MADARFESPLAHRHAPGGLSVSIAEVADRGMIDLKGDPEDDGFFDAAQRVLGFALPRTPRSSTGKGDLSALWMSIDQWLVLCPRAQAGDLQARLASALSDRHALAVDMSDARAVIRMEGEGVREVLMKGASVDFTHPDWQPGTVRRIGFGGIAALAHMVSAAPDAFDLYVFRSYADYAWDWLEATAREDGALRLFGRQEVPPV